MALPTLPQRICLPDGDPSQAFYLTAMFVIVHFFGLKWAERWVMGDRGEKGDFLRNDWSRPDHADIHKLRVFQLAEKLVNLQHVSGFWDVLEPMVGSGVEAGFAELEAGERLQRSGIRFEFRKPNGRAGESYDLDIWVEDLHICGETKCKVERTKIGVKSFLNSLGDARSKNLPADKAGAVFVKIPQSWLADRDFQSELERAVRDYLPSTGRLVAVFINASPHVLSEGRSSGIHAWKTILNPASRFYDPRMTALEIVQDGPTRWLNLSRLWWPSIMPEGAAYVGLGLR